MKPQISILADVYTGKSRYISQTDLPEVVEELCNLANKVDYPVMANLFVDRHDPRNPSPKSFGVRILPGDTIEHVKQKVAEALKSNDEFQR